MKKMIGKRSFLSNVSFRSNNMRVYIMGYVSIESTLIYFQNKKYILNFFSLKYLFLTFFDLYFYPSKFE